MDEYGFTDSLMAASTASLYAMEHSDIVNDNFDDLFSMLVSSFEDGQFIEKLHSLGPRGTVTKSIRLKPGHETLCFADRLWFNVKKTSSWYHDVYYVGIGLSMKMTDFNVIPYKKLWIARAVAGNIERIREKLAAPDMKEWMRKRLSDHVHQSCYDSLYELLVKPTVEED